MTDSGRLERLNDDITEIKVTLARLESYLHATPCSQLCEHVTRHSEDIAELHNQHKEHIEEHHSSRSLRNNWAALAALLCALVSLLGLFVRNGG